MNNLVLISDLPSGPQLTEDALTIKRNAVELAQEFVSITNDKEQYDCIAAASLIKNLLNRIEEAKVEAKKDALKKCQEIDALNRGLTGTIKVELARIEKLAAQYQAKVNAAAEALKREELAAMAEDKDMSEDAMRFRASRSAELAQVEKPSGAQFRTFQDYTIDNALAAATARPDLFTIEVKRREMLAYISIPNHKPIPGVFEFTNNTLHAKAS